MAAEKAKSALLLPEAREHLRRRAARRVRASIRFLRLVVQKFWLSFVLIWVLLTVGTLVIHTYARKDGIEPDYLESLFATYSLFSLESVYPMPKAWAARAVYFGYPLIGLLLVADTVVRATLLLFSRQENQKEWTRVLASTYRDHIILCGLGHVGYRILERLLHWHLDVVVIEKNTESSFLARTQQMGVPVLLMDARQEESLEAAGLMHARTLVIATNDDLANVEIALDARRLNPHIRVVLRMFDENIANKLRDAFHLDVAFSSAAAAAPLVAASVLDLDILGSFTLDGRELFTAKIEIGKESALLGTTIAYLANTHRVMVLSRKCGETPSHLGPAPEEQLTAGDILVLHGELDTLRRLSRLAR
ncbi:MAG TPA: NAD-binding protein [Pseudomonadota bacterium]|nr:NAD-binding protein [Pseudomonadota bacterium]HNN52049.1 NAD-binding protein [Pseudomonadota bacterium]HNO68911.1 NAD-binding protein [Pseudomonadota bacterium]